jgi:integrase
MDQIQQPLGDSKEVATIECARRVARFRELFARLAAGEQMSPNQIKAALRGPDEASLINEALRRWHAERANPWEDYGRLGPILAQVLGDTEQPAALPALPPATGETVSIAAEHWLKELGSGPDAPRPETVKGHRDRVQRFIDTCGDVPVNSVTFVMAADFLRGLDVSKRTRNNYATTLKCVFADAKQRGRLTGDNPFDKQRTKVAKGSNRVRFTIEELQTLFDALPCEIAPAKHTPDTALPWVALVALYSGARLEEIAQLTTADIREAEGNGAKVTVIDIHNGGTNKLKNESAARLVPVHSALVHAGFDKYVQALPAGPLWPGLVRRASKGNKIGARLGELFRKRLVALGLKREGLCFHSLRHTVSNTLDRAEVRQSDAARILGHAVEGMSFGEYSKEGPGLKVVAATVEQITYEGLRP